MLVQCCTQQVILALPPMLPQVHFHVDAEGLGIAGLFLVSEALKQQALLL